MTQTLTHRTFIPQDPRKFDPADFDSIEPWFDALAGRELPDAEAALRWLNDLSELSAAIQEYAARKSIDYACHTDDPAIEKAYLHFIEQIQPKLAPIYFNLHRKFLTSAGSAALEARDPKYRVLLREWRTDVAIFRDANVPLFTELTKLAKSYDKLNGAMLVAYDGKEYTLQQLAKFQEATDRAVRETTWRLSADRRLADREAIETIFERQLALRAKIAENADESDFRGYTWKSRGRFDYTPADCDAFAAAVAEHVVPVVEQLDARRRAALGVDVLRPWDLGVDVKGRAPLTPFADDKSLVEGTRRVFERIAPALGEAFGKLEFGRNLDLGSRKGKRAGGFQSSLTGSGEPFIFMNAAGLQRDVDTLLHEGGHAFHFLWAFEAEPLTFLQHAPLEFCEVASMSMELIGSHFMDAFYESEADRRRAAQHQFESVVRVLPWIATIDQFQHWLYTHEGHARNAREDAWLSVLHRFGSSQVDWIGLEAHCATLWHRQLHLFHYPFYYIEYGIAQLGALELWLAYRRNPHAALERYRAALSLGGTRTLPELFHAAGLSFDFSDAAVAPLMRAVAEELKSLET